MADKRQERLKMARSQAVMAGMTSFVIKETILAPLTRIKLLLQCQGEMRKTGRLAVPYKGVFDCARTIYRTEGILSFWKGNSAGCLMFLSYPLTIAFKEQLPKMNFLKVYHSDSYKVKLSKNIASGFLSGAASLVLLYNISYARVRLANDVLATGKEMSPRQFSGLIDVYRKTLRTDGIIGLHRGFMVSCLGIIVYRGTYFGLFDTLRPVVIGNGKTASPLSLFLLGYGVTLTAGVISYPLDTIRSRMIMTSCEPVQYKGWIDCGVQILKNEGVTALYGGVSINIFRGIFGAALLVLYDRLKHSFM
ncbi:PREDICTED: ADP,ATP carrier protein 3, mitochondrial-like [Amphimedon queenslandica]|uniref:ADP/ATP translocase n=1 Tax=Amphimedon queenslandica TaxID=400682 RepID=A0A1X7UK00_AMPQE|nr:PREDICTED: ADP,ATP carrier protein 3, mitochondrial-like [Amphimedon queenslandica]|eukprot:XP_003387564.2 PREDICTED: ADP,ATP carrier protein 3, mitochondrial-like [Amphimedon queenslandica]